MTSGFAVKTDKPLSRKRCKGHLDKILMRVARRKTMDNDNSSIAPRSKREDTQHQYIQHIYHHDVDLLAADLVLTLKYSTRKNCRSTGTAATMTYKSGSSANSFCRCIETLVAQSWGRQGYSSTVEGKDKQQNIPASALHR